MMESISCHLNSCCSLDKDALEEIIEKSQLLKTVKKVADNENNARMWRYN
jgi:hypothetical protein